ncbi:MAG: hypothetical protein CM15mP92_0620 [Halieaceae bacterium]|nr:MAG: hypothetical protein CM15mP92_0620 [Halieaceae bacterium]
MEYIFDKLMGAEELWFIKHSGQNQPFFFLTAAFYDRNAGLPHVLLDFFLEKKVSKKIAGWGLFYSLYPFLNSFFARTNLIDKFLKKILRMPFFKKREDMDFKI